MNSIKPGIDRPLRVIAYTDAAGIGGAEISLSHLVATASPDIKITVVGVAENMVNAIAQKRPQSPAKVIPDRHLFAHLITFLQLNPDIIHINCCTPWANATGLAAALMVPQARVLRVDQLPLRTTNLMTWWHTRVLSLRVDAHVAVGEACGRRLEDFYALGRDTVLSIPNGVPDWGEPPPMPNNETLTIGSVGRLDAMKGHDVLLRAIAQLENVRVVILGEGNERQNLEQLATELGISDRVELRGWVAHPRSALPQFDIIAQPSRSEGFPLAIVEAMLAARPVVATTVGSVPEAVIDGETGFLVAKNDIEQLASALRQLRDNPALRIRFGQRGREIASRYFTVEKMTNHYQDLWQKLVSIPPKPRLFIPRPRD